MSDGATPTSQPTATDALRQAAVEASMAHEGTPHVWGGASKTGADAPGLVYSALNSVGVQVPQTGQHTLGPRIDISQVKPGDLICSEDGTRSAVYVGQGAVMDIQGPGHTAALRPLGAGPDHFAVSLDHYYR